MKFHVYYRNAPNFNGSFFFFAKVLRAIRMAPKGHASTLRTLRALVADTGETVVVRMLFLHPIHRFFTSYRQAFFACASTRAGIAVLQPLPQARPNVAIYTQHCQLRAAC